MTAEEGKKEEEDVFQSAVAKLAISAAKNLAVYAADNLPNISDAFGVKDQPSEEIKVSQSLESLKKLGYRIEGPKTLDEITKEMNETVRKATEQAVKDTTAKLKSDEKKMAMLVDVGNALIEGLLPAITQAQGGAATGIEVAKNALKAATQGT